MIEVLKQALEDYLSHEMPAGTIIGDHKWWAKKIAKVAHQAIAELESQEPVAWMREDATLRFADGKMFAVGQPFYTHPPQRTWVGLDHYDKKKFSSWLDHKSDDEVFTAIEAKLKELNT